MDVDCKADASPVTIADKQAEEVMRALIQQTFPDHGIFGEEHGLSLGSGEGERYMWVLDPIDGTKSFITGGWLLLGKLACKAQHCTELLLLLHPLWALRGTKQSASSLQAA